MGFSSATNQCLAFFNRTGRTSTKSLAIREDSYRIDVPFVACGRLDDFAGMNVSQSGKGMAGSRKADHLDSPTTSAGETMVLVFVVLILGCTADHGRCPAWCGQAVGCCAFLLTRLPQTHTIFSLDSAFHSHSVSAVVFPCLFVFPLSKQHH